MKRGQLCLQRNEVQKRIEDWMGFSHSDQGCVRQPCSSQLVICMEETWQRVDRPSANMST